MNREQLIKIFTMKIDGHTYQEIGDELGISKQRVEQKINSVINGSTYKGKSNVIYPVLYREIKTRFSTVKRFCETYNLNTRRYREIINGKTEILLPEALKLCEIFDTDIDYLFRKKQNKERKVV